MESGDWEEYRRLVLSELERLDKKIDAQSEQMEKLLVAMEKRLGRSIESLNSRQGEMSERVVDLRIRASLWGALAGLLSAIGVALLSR